MGYKYFYFVTPIKKQHKQKVYISIFLLEIMEENGESGSVHEYQRPKKSEHPEERAIRDGDREYYKKMRTENRREIIRSKLETMKKQTTLGGRISELEELGYNSICVSRGKYVSLGHPSIAHYSRNVFCMCQRSAEDLKKLLEDPNKDSDLAKRLFDCEHFSFRD